MNQLIRFWFISNLHYISKYYSPFFLISVFIFSPVQCLHLNKNTSKYLCTGGVHACWETISCCWGWYCLNNNGMLLCWSIGWLADGLIIPDIINCILCNFSQFIWIFFFICFEESFFFLSAMIMWAKMWEFKVCQKSCKLLSAIDLFTLCTGRGLVCDYVLRLESETSPLDVLSFWLKF